MITCLTLNKRESIKTLILTLWKRDNEPPTRAEEVALSNAVGFFIEKIKEQTNSGADTGKKGSKKGVTTSFNGFYEFVKGDFQ